MLIKQTILFNKMECNTIINLVMSEICRILEYYKQLNFKL